MSKGFKIHNGQLHPDPRGFYLTPRRVFLNNGDGDPLLYHPDTGKPTAPFHEWMAWQWLDWACVYEGGGRDVHRDGMTVHVARGQCLYSLDYLMVAWGWKARSTVSRFLTRLEVSGRIRLDWPSVKCILHENDQQSATPPAASTARVNTNRGKTRKSGTPVRRIVQQRTQQLGRLITVLNYDTYQDMDFYRATPLATATPGVAGHLRYTCDTNKKSLKSLKKESGRMRRRAHSSPQPVDKPEPETTPATWDGIRGALRLGIWNNLPAHIQVGQLQEAFDAEPRVPNDLRNLATGGGLQPESDELVRLRQVREMLKGES